MSEMEKTATQAHERYRNDVRFRNIAVSVIADVMRKHGPVDPERADREAYDIAEQAVVLLLERIYTDDAELHALRAERDRYRKLAEQALTLAPMPPIFLNEKAASL